MSSKNTKAQERARKAAELREAQRKAEKRRQVLSIGGVVAVILVIVAGGFLINKLTDDSDDVSADRTSDYSVAIGDADAEHSIVIYEDFLCPICQAFEASSRDAFAKLADEGKVYVSYRPFNLFNQDGDPRKDYSVAAANAFAVVQDASGDEIAKKFHDLLYENQPAETGPFPDADDLVDLAVEAGAVEADVRPGIEDESMKSWVSDATKEAADAGVDSTPTILLDGKVFQDGATMADTAANLAKAVQ